MRVARITAFVVGAVSIFLAIKLQTINVAFLVGLAFAVAASANLPVIVLSIFWRRFNTAGAVWGLAVGLVSSIMLIIISPSVMGLDPKALIRARHFFCFSLAGKTRDCSIPLVSSRRSCDAFHARAVSETLFTELTRPREYGIGREKKPNGH